ncbi:MAG: hypothetical protein ACK5O2_11515 [Microthrixaceae bacterium]
MAKLGRKRARSDQPSPYPGDETPTYLRARFVAGVVVLSLLLGFVMYRLGSSGAVDVDASGRSAGPVAEVEDEAIPSSTDPADCPAAGEPVELEAAQLIRVFEAAAADTSVGGVPATAEVTRQLEVSAPSPALSRMTRIRGFVGTSGSWSSCVFSYWNGPEGPMQSLDVVTVALVPASERSDRNGSDSGGGSRSTTSSSFATTTTTARSGSSRPSGTSRSTSRDRWEVTRWFRGQPAPVAHSVVVPVMYFNGSGCGTPDRVVSVSVPDGTLPERITGALDELMSGAVGRSPSASTLVPADVSVIGVSVDGSRARIELTPTRESELSRCEGQGALAQVVKTAEGVISDALGPDVDPEVEVVVEGRTVSTLRP